MDLPQEVIEQPQRSADHASQLHLLLQSRQPKAQFEQFVQSSSEEIVRQLEGDFCLNLSLDTLSHLYQFDNVKAALAHETVLEKVQKNVIVQFFVHLSIDTPRDLLVEHAHLFYEDHTEISQFISHTLENFPDILHLIDVDQLVQFCHAHAEYRGPFAALGFFKGLSDFQVAPFSLQSIEGKCHLDYDYKRHSFYTLDNAEKTIKLIRKNSHKVFDICMQHPKIAEDKLKSDYASDFSLSQIQDLCNSSPRVAATILHLLKTEPNHLPQVPDNHYMRTVANQDIAQVLESVKEHNAAWNEHPNFLVARLMADGLANNIFILNEAAKCFDRSPSIQDHIVAFQLYQVGYLGKNPEATARLADNLYRGHGSLVDHALAFELYNELAEHSPNALSDVGAQRLIEQHLRKARSKIRLFEALKQQLLSLDNYENIPDPNEATVTKLQQKLTQRYRSFVSEHNVSAQQTQVTAQQQASKVASDILDHLMLVTQTSFSNRQELDQSLNIQTAHMMVVKVLMEQKECVVEGDWLDAMATSLRAAWDYDTKEQANPELAAMLSRIKSMHKGDLSLTIQSLHLEESMAQYEGRAMRLDEQAQDTMHKRRHSWGTLFAGSARQSDSVPYSDELNQRALNYET